MARLDQQNAPVANVGPPVADLCRRAVDLCRRVAPDDLAGLPLYVLAQSAIRDTLGEARQTYGYTLGRLDLILCNSLPKLQAEEKKIGRQIAEADAALARAEDTH